MKKIALPLLTALTTIVFLNGCNDQKPTASQSFLDTSTRDSSVKPGDNFFMYVNGKWFKSAVIPPTESDIGSALDLYNRTKDHLHSLLDSVSKGTKTAGSIEQKVADFYASGMDSATIDKLGYDPIKPYLQKI